MLELKDLDIVVEPGEQFSLSLRPNKASTNVNGTIHGGVMFLLCDDAVGRYVTLQGKKGAASEGSIHYYRAAKVDEKMTATVFERKIGRRLGIYLVELRNEEKVLLADAMFTITFATEEK